MNFKKLTAYSMSAIMVTSLVSGCSSDQSESHKSTMVNSSKKDNESVAASVGTGSGYGTKKETIYVTTKPNGSVDDITVSEWLKNPGNFATLKDVTNLSNIINVKGNEDFTTSDGEIAFDTDGNDIYYQGVLSKDTVLPVSLNIQYELDGKEISGDELNGKSGKLKMTIDYIANAKTDDGIYIPFLAATGMLLPTENFTNITVTNGTVISNGNYEMVVGMGLPGITDALSVDIPTSVELTADVTDFHIDAMMTVVTNNSLKEVDLSELDDIDNIPDMIELLSSSSTQLKDGAAALYDGLKSLNTGATTLSDGVTALDNGASDLKDGAKKLNNGAADLEDGAKKIDDGLTSLDDGISGKDGLSDGVDKLVDGVTNKETGLNAGVDKLVTGINGKNGLVNGINQLYDGITNKETGLNSGINQLYTGITDKESGLNAGINQLYTGITDNKSGLNAGINQLYVGITDKKSGLDVSAKQIQSAVNTISQTVNTMLLPYSKQLNTGVHTITATIRSLESTLVTLSQKYETLSSTLAEKEAAISQLEALAKTQPLTEEQLSTLKQLYQAQGQKEALKSIISSLPSSLTDTQKLNASLDGLDQLAAGIETISTKLDDGLTTNKTSNLTDAMKALTNGTGKLSAGITQLKTGSTKLTNGITALKKGSATLVNGITKLKNGSEKLATGVTKLNDGASTLSSGIKALKKGSKKLASGLTTLQNGVSKISTGTSALKDGSKELYTGTQTLSTGTSELYNGTKTLKDGTKELKSKLPELTDGVSKLFDGSKDLSEGMTKFDKEGIQKIVDVYEDNFSGAIEDIKASFDAGKEYTTFTGDGEGTSGTTTFIISTKY